MSQFPHDDFAKAYLPELLRPIGIAIPNHPLKAESRFADLWFVKSNTINPEDLNTLGLIGTLLTLIEVFRNAATRVEIRASQSKLSYQEIDEINQAKREDKKLAEADLPWLWLIMPTASKRLIKSFSIVPTEHPGVYQFPEGQRTGLIVVHQLEKTESTLWLRILGRAGKQKKAIEELSQRPQAAPMTATIEDLMTDYRAILEARGALTPEDEELIMNLSTVYLKQRETWKQEGLEEGLKQRETWKLEGLEEGLEEGRKEALKSVAIALLREGIDVELILKTTGIDRDVLQTLQSRL
jgi:hypothetical protein